MEKTSFVLENFGDAVGVIIAENESELMVKTTAAIQDNITADEDTKFELQIGRIGNFGEHIFLYVKYVENGLLVEDDEFRLLKLTTY